MSDTITLGKRRKDGQWIILVQPEKAFGDHLDAYRKIANNAPVNEDFSRVIIGKLHHASPALKLITAEEFKDAAKAISDREQSVKDIISSADKRQMEQTDKHNEELAEEHRIAVAEKNAAINKIRKDTNQLLIKLTSPPPLAPKANKYLLEYKDASKDELIAIQSASSDILKNQPNQVDVRLINDACSELLKKFN